MTDVASNALCGGVLRSPFARARISRINTSKAMTVAGVRAIVTAEDFPDKQSLRQPKNTSVDIKHLQQNLIAQGKVLYEGQPIVAIAADDEAALQAALTAIDIEYAVLPHVIDVRRAMEPEAPLLHESLFTAGIEPPPKQASNVASRLEKSQGHANNGLSRADVLVADEFTTEAVYPDGVALPSCQAWPGEQGVVRVKSTSQSPEQLRSMLAALLCMSESEIRTEPSGGRSGVEAGNLFYLEPFALLLALKSQRPVVMQANREDTFRAMGAMPGSYISMRLGADRKGKLQAAEVVLCMQAGAFPGAPVQKACEALLAMYLIPEYRVIAYDVVVNRPMVATCPASAAAAVSFALDSLLDELAGKLGMSPLALRLLNAESQEPPRLAASLQSAQSHMHSSALLPESQGRGIASGCLLGVDGEVLAGCTHMCDVAVDSETGHVTVLRYTIFQTSVAASSASDSIDSQAVTASHIQAATTMGLGRALHEAYVFDENGRMANTSFLDYHMPLACDLPPITVVFTDNEACAQIPAAIALARSSIHPPLAAVANAIADATSARITSLPMSLPVVLAETQRQKWKKRLRRRR